jgi:hypothetical protein
MEEFNWQYFSNFELFWQMYFISLFKDKVIDPVGIQVNTGSIFFLSILKEYIPNSNVKYGTLKDYLNNSGYYYLLDYNYNKALVKFPDKELHYTDREWEILIGYGLSWYFDYVDTKKLKFRPVDYTPPKIEEKYVNIYTKMNLIAKLQSNEYLTYKELIEILESLKSDLSKDDFESLYAYMYERMVKELNANI